MRVQFKANEMGGKVAHKVNIVMLAQLTYTILFIG
jgi:hypothetical protein